MAEKDDHREFLNKYYGISRHFYDLTRKYYLFGRDVSIRELLKQDWASLVEMGAGTGRNLRKLHAERPGAKFGAVDASDEMLKHIGERYHWCKTAHGFAEDSDLTQVLGDDVRPDRVLFSYCLSMVQDQKAALENAKKALAPGGLVHIVDFADLGGMPGLAERGLRKWLNTFHVHPLNTQLLEEAGATLRFGPGRYYVIAEIAADA